MWDWTILYSFDRSGYRRHARRFRPGDLDVDLAGKTCLVTGANSGIGYETALGLATRGAEVVLLCRDPGRGHAALTTIREKTGNDRVRLEVLDVSSLGSIRALTDRLDADQVDVLVHNAGVLPGTREETPDGIERTLATHVIGPLSLTHLLLPRLKAAGQARIIWVSSGGMYSQRLSLDDIEWRGRKWNGTAAYAQTKRMQVILSEMLARRLDGTCVVSNAMHPGWADTPAVRTSLPGFYRAMKDRLRTPSEGADTVLWLVACPRISRVTGRFWMDREERRTHYLPWTRESDGDRRDLWDLCGRLAGIEDVHDR